MEERLSFDILLEGPEEGDDEWAAHHRGLAGYGDSEEEALGSLVVQLREIVEDVEYNRVYGSPGIPGHPSGSAVPQVQQMDNPEVPQRRGSPNPYPIHPPEQPKDRV